MAHQSINELVRAGDTVRRSESGEKTWFFNPKSREALEKKPLTSLVGIGKWEPFTLDHDKQVQLQSMSDEGGTYFNEQSYRVTIRCKVKVPDDADRVSTFLDKIGYGKDRDVKLGKEIRRYVQNKLEDEKGTLERAEQDSGPLNEKCTKWIAKKLGLDAVVNIQVSATKMELSLSAFAVQTKARDHIKILTPKVTATFKARSAKERKPLNQAGVERIVTETVDEYIRGQVSLQEYQFDAGHNSAWMGAIHSAVQTKIDRLGWDVDHFYLEVPHFIGYRADSDDLSHLATHTPPKYGQEITIKCTAQIAVFDAARFESSNYTDKQNFLETVADETVKKVLFHQGFTDLLINWVESEKSIKAMINQAAELAGLSIDTIFTRPDLAAIDLLDGWRREITSVKFSNGTGEEEDTTQEREKYKTKGGKDLVDFDLNVTLVVSDLSQIRSNLDQHKDRIGEFIRTRIKQTVAAYARTRTTEDFYIRFEPDQFSQDLSGTLQDSGENTAQLPSFSEGVAKAVSDMLVEEFAASKSTVQVTQDTGEVGKRYEQLVTAPSLNVPVRLVTKVSADGGSTEPIYFDLMIRAAGVTPDRWGTFQGYNWEKLMQRFHRERHEAMLDYTEAKQLDRTALTENEEGLSQVGLALLKLEQLGLSRHDTVNPPGEADVDIPLDELVNFHIASQISTEIGRHDGALFLNDDSDHVKKLHDVFQGAVNKIAKSEFGLLVDLNRCERRDSREESSIRETRKLTQQIERETTIHSLSSVIADKRSQTDIEETQRHAKLAQVEMIDKKLLEALDQPNYSPDDPYVVDLKTQRDNLAKEQSAPNRAGEHAKDRIEDLRGKLRLAEQALDALPPPKTDEARKEFEEREEDVKFYQDRIDGLEKETSTTGKEIATTTGAPDQLTQLSDLAKSFGDDTGNKS